LYSQIRIDKISPKINVTIQIILWLPPEKKNTRLPTP
jgi:hypothetical protein